MPSSSTIPEPAQVSTLIGLRTPLVAALAVAVVLGLFGWPHAGHGIDWPRYALAILLVYGAAFVVLGAMCFVVPSMPSQPLSMQLRWLGSFALLHASKELHEAWALATGQADADAAWLEALWLLASYLPLLEFSRRLWQADGSLRRTLPAWWLSPRLYGVLALLTAMLATTLGALPAVHIAARLLVALPAAALATAWLWRCAERMTYGQGACTTLAVALGMFGLLSGALTESNAGAPTWMPTTDAFEAAVGLPVHLLRAVCAVLATVALGRLAMLQLMAVAVQAERNATDLALQVEEKTRSNVLAQQALDSAQDAIAIADVEGRISYVNPSFLSTWAYRDAAQVIGTHATEHWRMPMAAQEVIEVLVRDGHWKGELEALRGDGVETPMRVVAALIREHDGRPVAMMATFRDMADLRLAQRAERDLRAFNEAIIQHAGTLVLVLDAKGRIVLFNRACEKTSGRSSESVLGLYPWDVLLPPEQAEQVRQAAFLAMKRDPQRPTGRYANEWMDVNGRRTLLDWFNTVLFDDEGQFTHMVSVGVDITERSQMTAALAKSEQALNDAQRLAHVGSWELDLGTGQLSWSDEIFRIFEIDQNRFEATYEAFLAAVHPDDRNAVNAAYTQSLVHRGSYGIDHRLLMPDGRVKWVQERGISDFDADGRPLRSRGTVQDITERHLRELELDKHRTKLEVLVRERTSELETQSMRNALILGTAVDGFFTTDAAARLLEVNEAYCRMLGYSRAEMLALTTADIDGDEDPGQAAARADAVRRRGHGRFETRHRRKDGGLVDVEVSMNLVDLKAEWFFFAFVRDITDRRRSERALHIARHQAEQANRAKTDFMSGMSHELRTPMNAILGFSQLLRLQALSAEQLDAVGEIYGAGQHLLSLIDDLLDLSRIEAGNLAVTMVPVDVHAVVAEAVRIAQPMFNARSVALSNILPEGASVQADPLRLRQVLVNLLSNAAKYNHSGGRVSIDAQATDPQRLRIRVSDTGPGIAPELLPRLFRTFERLGAEHSDVEGSGIGLALSKQLAERMGGSMGVESLVGQGSTFWIELAQVAPVVAADAAGAAQKASPAALAAPFEVLYIEDNRANQKVVELTFQTRPDWRLRTASTGPEGLELARNAVPDAILLDIHLPGMDGYAVLQALRADPRTASVPVVALSADAMRSHIERGLQSGLHDYLAKPLDLERLLTVMTTLADAARR